MINRVPVVLRSAQLGQEVTVAMALSAVPKEESVVTVASREPRVDEALQASQARAETRATQARRAPPVTTVLPMHSTMWPEVATVVVLVVLACLALVDPRRAADLAARVVSRSSLAQYPRLQVIPAEPLPEPRVDRVVRVVLAAVASTI